MKFIHDFSLVSESEIEHEVRNLNVRIEKLHKAAYEASYASSESFLHLAHDKVSIDKLFSLRESLGPEALRYILVIGIGGSSLGAQAIYQALLGYQDIVSPKRFPKLIVVDTVDPEFNARLGEFLKNDIGSLQEIAVVVVSKSGTTVETATSFNMALDALGQRFSGVEKRISVVTDEGSALWNFADTHALALRVAIPKHVGGRFSVFSGAGLFPLVLCGIDIVSLCEGARSVSENITIESGCVRSAAIIHAHYKKGVKINNSFFFHPEFEWLGKWWRQLIGESLGKEGVSGKPEGIIPHVSIGTIDLHSVGQMYLAGAENALTNFVWVSAQRAAEGNEKILHAIFEGVKKAYTEKRMPFSELHFNDVSPRSLGEYMQFKMIETVLLAHLMGVNAFDQPNVDAYKAHTRKILGE